MKKNKNWATTVICMFLLACGGGGSGDGDGDPTTGVHNDNIQLVVGSGFTCVLGKTGKIQCVGDNGQGQLGDGTGQDSLIPVDVADISDATAISAKLNNACVIRSDKTVWCWGFNDYGQLQDAKDDNGVVRALRPVKITGVSDVVSIEVGDVSICAILASGKVKCWGSNYHGELGNGSKTDTTTPTEVKELSNVKQIVSGSIYRCALLENKTVKCWGSNMGGALGNGTGDDSLTPVLVPSLSDVRKLSGGDSACAILSDDTFKCWGRNNYGQIGDGTYDHAETPVSPVGVGEVLDVSGGAYHTCAVLKDHTARCWGYNQYGQLGNDEFSFMPDTTIWEVKNLSNANSIVTDSFKNCTLNTDESISCWGEGEGGGLGNGKSENSSVPVKAKF